MRSTFPVSGLLLSALLATACASASGPAPAMTQDGALVGANGMALYVFDRDAAGKSACNGPCAANWPPLAAAAYAPASGDWSVVTRDDGSRQWAYKGRPLYFWSRDKKAGERSGDGFNGVWHLARP
ncbi:MAG: hypothetical protein KGM91_15765 [Burkholderiales bacterium]|nr:hypothetical protein [Burkholderiales bacterium]